MGNIRKLTNNNILCSICARCPAKCDIGHNVFLCDGICGKYLTCLSCKAPTSLNCVLCSHCEKLEIVTTNKQLRCAAKEAFNFIEAQGIIFTPRMLQPQFRDVSCNFNYKENSAESNNAINESKNGFKNCLKERFKSFCDFIPSAFNCRYSERNQIEQDTVFGCSFTTFFDAIPIMFMKQANFRTIESEGEVFVIYRYGCTSMISSSFVKNPKIKSIEILKGMPYHRTVGTLIHEFLHAYIFLNRLEKKISTVDEFCDVTQVHGKCEEQACLYSSHLYWNNLPKDSFNAMKKSTYKFWSIECLHGNQVAKNNKRNGLSLSQIIHLIIIYDTNFLAKK